MIENFSISMLKIYILEREGWPFVAVAPWQLCVCTWRLCVCTWRLRVCTLSWVFGLLIALMTHEQEGEGGEGGGTGGEGERGVLLNYLGPRPTHEH